MTDSAPNLRPTKLSSTNARIAFAGAAFGAFLLASVPCHAQTSTIGANEFVQSQGIVDFNQAAGDANQEANHAFIAPGNGELTFSQFSDGTLNPSDSTNVSIGANVGANARGIVQITQVAGNGNLLANAIFIGVDPNTSQPLDALQLSQTRISQGPTNFQGNIFNGHATIAPSAFAGANATIQVAQVAGNNNVVSNTLEAHLGP